MCLKQTERRYYRRIWRSYSHRNDATSRYYHHQLYKTDMLLYFSNPGTMIMKLETEPFNIDLRFLHLLDCLNEHCICLRNAIHIGSHNIAYFKCFIHSITSLIFEEFAIVEAVFIEIPDVIITAGELSYRSKNLTRIEIRISEIRSCREILQF